MRITTKHAKNVELTIIAFTDAYSSTTEALERGELNCVIRLDTPIGSHFELKSGRKLTGGMTLHYCDGKAMDIFSIWLTEAYATASYSRWENAIFKYMAEELPQIVCLETVRDELRIALEKSLEYDKCTLRHAQGAVAQSEAYIQRTEAALDILKGAPHA